MIQIPDEAPEVTFRNGLKEGRLLLQRCADSGRCFFYPRTVSPFSGSSRYTWQQASGAGTVYSTTVVRQKAEQGGDYNLCLVDLAEGPRMMSRVEDIDPAQVTIGMKVTAFIATDDKGEPLVLFRPSEAAP
ncbi:Zn-ribbon domain-containing OB-fold protein [Devosia sp.]|uniref:Zn-ribbon domain-containing OB-fold protein n=1 Tax=Devosia sp. TaxID=1871048 RepID=UPI002F11FFA4